jgi:MarR family transcriptional regulator for hemolysin
MGNRVENELLILLSEVARHIRTHADRSVRRHGMTWAQFAILGRLEQQPDLTQSELAAITEVAPITIARLVDRMEALGLVKREPDPENRRIWRLRTTPAAAPALRDGKRYQAKLDEIIIKGVDSNALDVTIIGLRKMRENLSRSRRLAKASR